MKRNRRLVWFITGLFTLLSVALIGCGGGGGGGGGTTTPPQQGDAAALVNDAKNALANEDMATANAKFKAAYTADPANKDAAFGVSRGREAAAAVRPAASAGASPVSPAAAR